MRFHLLFTGILFSLLASAQQDRDTVLKHCPVFITDTATTNNFFIEALPATVKVYHDRGKLTISVQQKDQFFTLFFRDKKLREGVYKIYPGADGKYGAEAKYSFRSDGQVSFVNVSRGTIEVLFDKEKEIWHLKINGMIANLVERYVTWYKVKVEIDI